MAERHKVVIIEQTAKVYPSLRFPSFSVLDPNTIIEIHLLEAYLDGKVSMMDWNQFDCINFQPLTFTFPPAPTSRPSETKLRHERVEVVAYVDVLESQACRYVYMYMQPV